MNVYEIVIADDDAAFRSATRRLLQLRRDTFKTRVREAADGAATLACLTQAAPVDCLLLDNLMPGGLGLEWLTRFLQVQPALAVVMVTGNGDEATAVKAMQGGAVDYLVKGRISSELLEKSIRSAVEKVQMRAQLERQRELLRFADQHRLMVESLGAACRRLAEPVSVVTGSLEIMKRQDSPPMIQDVIANCCVAVDAINEFLDKLNAVCASRPTADGGADSDRVSMPEARQRVSA
ncbi:MAG: response regulator [Lentisphaerae bacterium]|nr:response regulator [Lentisphaerota bacterium]